jgi:uncharacterized protein (DUF779 family)
MADKVTATPAALELIAEIVADHGRCCFTNPEAAATVRRRCAIRKVTS